jgi:hypothetical protein
VVAALALTGAALVIIVGLGTAARMVHIGNLDALALAEKLATPLPVSALDWPELRVRAVVSQPDRPSEILLLAEWPSHRERTSTLLIEIYTRRQIAQLATGLQLPPSAPDLSAQAELERQVALLSQWCDAGASVMPSRRGPAELELRRRQSLERVRGRLLAEDLQAEAAVPPSTVL